MKETKDFFNSLDKLDEQALKDDKYKKTKRPDARIKDLEEGRYSNGECPYCGDYIMDNGECIYCDFKSDLKD